MKKNTDHLPESIRVEIVQDKDGYSAKLPEYDVFTCAESEQELQFMLDDLIKELFSIPKKLQSQIFYKRINQRSNKYLMFSTPNVFKKEFSCA